MKYILFTVTYWLLAVFSIWYFSLSYTGLVMFMLVAWAAGMILVDIFLGWPKNIKSPADAEFTKYFKEFPKPSCKIENPDCNSDSIIKSIATEENLTTVSASAVIECPKCNRIYEPTISYKK